MRRLDLFPTLAGMGAANRRGGPLRLRAGFALLLALFAFVAASVRAPALALPAASVAALIGTPSTIEASPPVAPASIELHRVATARLGRGAPPRPQRMDGGPPQLVVASSEPVATGMPGTRRSTESPFGSRGTWAPTAKTHADLMVFLN